MMTSCFKYLDYYSLDIHLTYKGKEKYRTIGGGILTILTILIILFNAWLIGNDIYKKENPTVISSDEDLGYTYPNYTISYNNFFLGYFFSDHENNPFDDETVIKVVPVYYTNEYNTNGTLTYNETQLEVTSCSNYFSKNKLEFPLSSEVMSPLKCINNFNHSFGGFWTVNYIRYVYFQVFTCRNETLKQGEKQCKSKEEINYTLSKLYFNLFYQSVLVNAKNYTNPIKTIITEDWFVMQPNLFKGIYYHFQNFMVKSDSGIIFNSEIDVKETLGFQKLRQDYRIIDNKDDNIVFIFEFYLSNQNKIYQRSYITLQYIFANLGGIIQVIIIVTKFFYNFYLKKKFNTKIMNNLYEFDSQDKRVDDNRPYTILVQKPLPNNLLLNTNKSREKLNKNSNSPLSSIKSNMNIRNSFSSNKDMDIAIEKIKSTQKKKIKFKTCELITSIYCPKILRYNSTKVKDLLYKNALRDAFKSRDLMRIIRNSQNLTKLKYLLLSHEQLMAFDYLEKPVKTLDGQLIHKVKNYAEAFENSDWENKKGIIGKVVEYFYKLSRDNRLTEVDEKLLSIIDKRIVNLINSYY